MISSSNWVNQPRFLQTSYSSGACTITSKTFTPNIAYTYDKVVTTKYLGPSDFYDYDST
jgi:hypothetical protein